MKYLRQMLAIAVVAVFCVVMFSACDEGMTKKTYPYLEYRSSQYNLDIKNKVILLGDGFYLDDSHPYDTVYTDDGYDLVIHFVKE